jgi:xyloglucan-specific endo-beta-1,4-glucanase
MKIMKSYRLRATLASLSAMAVLFGFASSAQAAPTCASGPKSTLVQGPYILQNNMFGAADDSTGTQNICNVGNAANAWSSQWTWAAGTGVTKSFPSIYLGWNQGTSMPDSGFPGLVAYQFQIPTSVKFSVTGSGAYAVGYRVYFSPETSPDKPSAEMQIWLKYSGMTPKGKKVYSNSAFKDPEETWDVWKGIGDDGWPVFTFVRTASTTSFSAKLQPFIYCVYSTMKGFEKSWYTLGVQFGALVVQSNGAKGSLNVSEFSVATN